MKEGIGMDIYEFANLLNGRQMDYEMTAEEEKQAEQLGFVVVFGYSDDVALLRGAIRGSVDCIDGGPIYFKYPSLLKNRCQDNRCPYFEQGKKGAKVIEAVWCDYGYSWVYKTDIPHATFDIMEDGEKFCRGIVFDIKNLQ
jgi:hypothetical protein